MRKTDTEKIRMCGKMRSKKGMLCGWYFYIFVRDGKLRGWGGPRTHALKRVQKNVPWGRPQSRAVRDVRKSGKGTYVCAGAVINGGCCSVNAVILYGGCGRENRAGNCADIIKHGNR